MFIKKLKEWLFSFFRYQDLLKELVVRDIKVKYRRSVLGYIWSVLNPLLMMVVISTVFSHMFRFDIENYPVYLLTGQLVYNFYSESTNFAMTSIINGGSLIKKVYLPKYIFPLSRVLSSFVNLLFSLTALIIILVATKAQITPAFFLFPLPLIYLLLLCIGVGLIMSVVTVFFRDMLHLYGVFLTALMYMTPIFYPVSAMSDEVVKILKLNPLFHIVGMFRKIVMDGQFPTLRENIVCLAFSVVFILIGLVVFKKKQDNFVLYL